MKRRRRPIRQGKGHSGRQSGFRYQWRRLLLAGLAGLGVLLSGLLLVNILKLQSASSGPVDAYFVLGGSIRREIYVAQLIKDHPQTRILISQGSTDPCIKLIFQREQAPLEGVWLERCAHSTFGNFYYGIPILRQWGVRKVKLITSGSHTQRALRMGQILFGAHGIWVEPEIVQEEGVPGNKESFLKTTLDLSRALGWAVLSQMIQPQCSKLTQLTQVDLKDWRRRGFQCEHQGKVK